MLTALISFLSFKNTTYTQDKKGIFAHVEYQVLKNDFLQFGIGFHPKKHLVNFSRRNGKYTFIGYTLNYSTQLNNSDWGLALQSVAYSATYEGPIGVGLELNMKNRSATNHFGFKPLIGLSFPMWSVMYGHHFDLNRNKMERINQHELIFGLRLRCLKW